MKVALVLPLFSEHRLNEYLGIELVATALRTKGHDVEPIDLNERLVDFLLRDRSHLQALMAKVCGGDDRSPSARSLHFERYLSRLSAYPTAQALTSEKLYAEFFSRVVSTYFGAGDFHRDDVLQRSEEILAAAPVLDAFLSDECEKLGRSGFQAVLVSVPHADQLMYALLFSQNLKKRFPEIPVIFGGCTITLMDLPVLKRYADAGFFDYHVTYHGEEKIVDLLDRLAAGEPVDQAALEKKQYVDINQQLTVFYPDAGPAAVPVLYSRGCYWGKCSYCTYIYLDGGRFTRKDLNVFLTELEQFSDQAVRVSVITESLRPKDARMIAEGILRRGIRIHWGAFIRVNTQFDASLFSLLRKSGCLYSCVGVESVNDHSLGILNKGYRKADVYQFFGAAKDAGFRFFQVNFIYDIPGTTLHDELENLSFISDFREVIGNIASFQLEITRQSYLGQHLSEFGIQEDPHGNRSGVRVDTIPFVSSLDREDLMVLSRAYQIAAEYFRGRDVSAGVRRLAEKGAESLSLDRQITFEFDNRFYLGSVNTLRFFEIPEPLFRKLEFSKTISLEALSQPERLILFDLGIIGNDR